MNENIITTLEEQTVVCPYCYNVTEIEDEAETFICTVCKRQFRLEDLEYEAHKED